MQNVNYLLQWRSQDFPTVWWVTKWEFCGGGGGVAALTSSTAGKFFKFHSNILTFFKLNF
jgi:hypothetical protein